MAEGETMTVMLVWMGLESFQSFSEVKGAREKQASSEVY